MPTGYTAPIAEGKIDNFPDFAMNCARAFGALVMMRDSPSDAEIPERFEPLDYHPKKIADLRAELVRLEAMTGADATAERDMLEAKRIAERTNYADRKLEQKERYEAMLVDVRKWVPPTTDHAEMKKFMIQQLEESIDFDCRPSEYMSDPLPSADEWLADAISVAQKDIKYHEEKHREEVERTEGRNEWLSALRDSLKTYA